MGLITRRGRGSGSVRLKRPPDRWEVRAPVPGTGTQVSRSVRGNRREAERALRDLLSEVDRGHHRHRARTVADVFARWLALVGPDLSPATLANYEGNVRRYVLPVLGDKALDRLEPADLDELYISLRNRPGRRPLAASSIRLIHSIVHRGLRQAELWGWIVRNPASRATPPPQRAPEIIPPTWDEIADLLRQTEEHDPDLSALIFVAAFTGMRRGELCALRWGDSPGDGAIKVARGVIDLTGGGTLEKDTKTHRVRTIAIADALAAVLVAHRARMEARAANAGTELALNGYVFSPLASGSAPMRPISVTHRFAKARDRAGYTFRLHDVRHFHATFLLGRGVDVKTVSGRLGHAGGMLTLNLYGHFQAPLDRAAADIMGELLPPTTNAPPPEGSGAR